MREFKFRAWDKRKKVMMYSYMKKGWQQLWLFFKMLSTLYTQNVGFIEFYFKSKKYPRPIIMQWTGLKDKNGKDIYEGDIVKTNLGNKSEIRFIKGCFWLMTSHKIPGRWWTLEHFFDYEKQYVNLEVIGNSFENPKLLK